MNSSQRTPTWMLVMGVTFLAVSLLFFMVLVLIAVLLGKEVPFDSRFLVVIILSLTTAAGSGFLGGYAKASGKISLPFLKDPLSFGLTGGIAVFILVLFFGHLLYSGKENVNPPFRDTINRVEMLEMTVKALTLHLESLPTESPERRQVAATKSDFQSAIESAKLDPSSLEREPIAVAIIVAHSEDRPGAVSTYNNNRISEFAVCLGLASKIQYQLHQKGLDSRLFFRKGHDSKSPYLQAALHRPKIVLELHANASNTSSARGSVALVRSGDEFSKTVAEEILAKIQQRLEIPTRGVKSVAPGEIASAALYATLDAAIIIDPFFLTSPEDMAIVMEQESTLAGTIAGVLTEKIKS